MVVVKVICVITGYERRLPNVDFDYDDEDDDDDQHKQIAYQRQSVDGTSSVVERTSNIAPADSDDVISATPGTQHSVLSVYFLQLIFLLFLFFLLGRYSSKSLKAVSFQIGSVVEILHDYSSSKFASIDEVRILIRHHTFKMAAMTSSRRSLLRPPAARYRAERV